LLWVRSDRAPENADEPAEASVISLTPKVTPGCETNVRHSSGARWNPGGTGAVSSALAGVPAARCTGECAGESEWGIGIASQVGGEPVDNHSAPSSATHRTLLELRPAPAVLESRPRSDSETTVKV
jgi:hypothetical protein